MSNGLADGAAEYRFRGNRSVRDADVNRCPYGMLLDTSCALVLARRIAPGVLCFRASIPGRMDENLRRTESCSVGLDCGETEDSLGLSWRNDKGETDDLRGV